MRAIIASLLIATATPAFAAPLTCVFTSTKGEELIYSFEAVSGDLYAEAAFSKNGVTTTSPVGKRPPWRRIEADGSVGLIYLRDPRFWIGIPNLPTQTSSDGSVVGKFAILAKDKLTIGKGGCGFMTEQPQTAPDGL